MSEMTHAAARLSPAEIDDDRCMIGGVDLVDRRVDREGAAHGHRPVRRHRPGQHVVDAPVELGARLL
jgi:hypothetical protein